MSDKTEKKQGGKPFEKDDPRINRAGRPKGVQNFTTRIREGLLKIADGETMTNEELLEMKIFKKAVKQGDNKMIELIWNYLDGKPINRTEADIKGDLTIQLTQYGDKD